MTKSKRKKKKQRILDALNKGELSTDKGGIISRSFRLSHKDRKHSGRYTPQLHQKGKFSEMISNAEEPKNEYDEWISHRDGFRDCKDQMRLRKNKGNFWKDPKEIKEINKKIKKKLAIKKNKKIKKINYS